MNCGRHRPSGVFLSCMNIVFPLHKNLFVYCFLLWDQFLPLVDMQVRTLHEEKRLEVLVDRDLKGCFDVTELETCAELALQCTQSSPNLRPKMSDVLKILEGLVEQSVPPEDPQGGTNPSDIRTCSFSRDYSDIRQDSSFIIEAIELSGPR